MGKNRLLAAMLAVCAAGVVMLRVFDPATSGIFPPCPVHYLTGWYCPGCGSLRAIHQLLHGNLRAAWALNPLTVVLLPCLTYGLASFVLFEVRGQGFPSRSCERGGFGRCVGRLFCLGLFGIFRCIRLNYWHRGRCSGSRAYSRSAANDHGYAL